MRTALVVISLFLFAGLHPSATAQSDRIAASIDRQQSVIVPGSVHPRAQLQHDLGAVEASMPLPYITLLTKPSPQQQADLDRLLAEQQDPTSRRYHKWLTPEQYAGRFGLSRNDIEKLAVWLRSEGFTIVTVARGHDWIAFSGSAALVESAFHSPIHYYYVDDELHFANATEVSLPASLAGIVSGIRGLNDFSLRPMGIKTAPRAVFPALVQPSYNLGGFNFLAPGDIATIYNIAPLYTSGIDGTGMKMVIVGQVDVSGSLTDIDNFRTAFGLAKNDPAQTIVPGSPNPGTSSADMVESKLDLEWAGAAARSAKILFITAATSTDGVFNAARYAIDQNLAPVISMSYGGCEADNAGFISVNEVVMKKASSEGITFLASSGDDGAAACDDNGKPVSVATHGLSVNYPASSPEVTGVGGNEFNEGSGTFWTASGPNGGTATSYIPETAWNDTISRGSLSASGGGASSCATAVLSTCTGGFGFPKPVWQTGKGVPADGVRDVPDVALSASPDHDGYIICNAGSCAGGVGTSPSIVGGTSASTPVFAGIVTLLNQAVGGSGLGNINLKLYQLAQNTSNGAFHDVTSGDNNVPCTPGTTSCPAKSPFQFGYIATAGYDQVTGLGSVDADKLVAAWTSKPATSISLSLTATTITAGTSITFTANVTHSTGTAVPTGTVKFNNGTTTLGSTTLDSTAKATFQTSSLLAGAYSITAAYAGDGNYAASTSSAQSLTVQPSNKSATTTGLTLSNSAVTAGASITFTANITHTAGSAVPSGTVTFNNGSTKLGSATLDSTAKATFQTTSLAAGTYSVIASYSGDGNYNASTSSAGSLSVQDFATPAANPTTVTVSSPGLSGTTTVTITPIAGFSQAVSFSCAGLPAESTCSFNPTSVTPSGKAVTTTLTIATTAASAGLRQSPMGRSAGPFYALLLPGLLGIVIATGSKSKWKRSHRRMLGFAIFCALTLWLPACGGGSGGGGTGNPGTPTGQSSVTVSATAGATLSHSVQITLSVQ